ncbi:MAG: hypothetical protein WCT28_03870 [Patescibacteria group bacterium]|jgi:hypothetical protein
MLNMQGSQRNWFPVIVAGLTVLLACIFYGTHRQFDFSTLPELFAPKAEAPVADAVTEAEYQNAVQTILSTYTAEKSAQAAYDACIQLRVPTGMQTFHIDLIIALGKLVSGDVADGQSRLDALQAQNSWFTM